MDMDLTGIKNVNEYYTNHYFTSIFKDNADDTISAWRQRSKEEETVLPWNRFRDTRRQYNLIREDYRRLKNQEQSKPLIQGMAGLYLDALGYGETNSVLASVADGIIVPVFHEETRSNGAPLMWAFLSVSEEMDDDILNGHIFARSADDEDMGATIEMRNDDILAKLFFAGEEAPRFIILIGIDQIALIDRNKWNEKRYLQFSLDDIFSRHEESTFMALTVLLHKESLCPADGAACLLDSLDENSHKHSAGVSDALKYALRECIEILGNEVIYDMKTRQGINLEEHPVDAGELTLECLRYMYRFLFMLFIEARPELGYAPMKSQTYVQGYSLEGLRDVCARVKEESETVSEGYYICDTITELFKMIYDGYPVNLDEYKKATAMDSLHDVFTVEALKAHIFDPEYTKMITKAKLRNSAMLRIVDLMSISRPKGSRERKGRISYSALGINQMGAVYEALLSYRGFIAQETLFEVKRAGDDFDELNVGYFIPEKELDNYTQEERVRENKNDPKSPLRKYEKGTFIYRLAGREREKSASYYTPEVLTKCLVKYALKELLEGKTADEILNLTICEPAMGSAAFLNEAINQIAEAYLNKKQEELGEQIAFNERFEKLQQVKMYIADRNVYGVDLNPIAVELAEVSLWLNTIYKGAYVPWFGTQLVCGNSLIGARRQVYYTTKLENGKWYEEAPDRIMPGEKRKRTGVSSRVYHFLLGDPGMSNYTDKVIKGLEPENIKKINEWRKDFTRRYTEDDIKTLLNLSDIIDKLWERTVDLRKKIEKATGEPFSVYGHEEVEEGMHTTIREKDEIYKREFKSERMNNAGPYARLKAAMDYWCALWFWPIDKADLLPTRQIFFMEMYMILQGAVNTSLTKSSGQYSFLDDSGQMQFNEDGKVKLQTQGIQSVLDFTALYSDLGEVNLDDLRIRNERFRIADQIAKEQKFHHWELEFADIFEEKGGFDLVIGNPPWIKVTWNEADVLSEKYPEIIVKNLSSSKVATRRNKYLLDEEMRGLYISEASTTSATLNYYNAAGNYAVLAGGQTDLFKCFLPTAWMLLHENGVGGYIHPEGVYEEQNAGLLRSEIYKRLVYHFQFQNEKYIFPIAHSKTFSINIFANRKKEIKFINVNNLYAVSSIEGCFNNTNPINYCKKDEAGNWNLATNIHRALTISEEELKVFTKIYGAEKILYTRLPVIHTDSLLEVLKCFTGEYEKINGNDFFGSEMWHETYAVSDGIIMSYDGEINEAKKCVLSGPNVGEANMYAKQPRVNCSSKGDYDNIALEDVVSGIRSVPRVKYIPCDIKKYNDNIPLCEGVPFDASYRLVFRKMLSKSSELNLKCTIIPPDVGFVHSLVGYSFKDIKKMVYLSGLLNSIVFIYLINSTGKMNFTSNTISIVPIPDTDYSDFIIMRGLRLNALSSLYSGLWEKILSEKMLDDMWAINSPLIRDKYELSKEWTTESPIYRDFERYIAMIELDVLSAKSIGMTLDQLCDLYKINYPNMAENEANTWYDQNGRIVFTTNKSMVTFGVSRSIWDNNKNVSFKAIDQLGREIDYISPYIQTNRLSLYQEAWDSFDKRIKK